MRVSLVWIRLYSLPSEYWDPEILEDLGNCLGKFIKISEKKKIQRYNDYAWIYTYMDLSKEFLETNRLTWEDEDWMQTLDYEQIFFHCHRCHEYGHLFK